MTTDDTAVLAAAAGAWFGFAYKLHHLRQRPEGPGRSALVALVFVLFFLAGTFTLTPFVVGRLIDSVVGLPGFTRFVANLLSMSNCLAILGWLLFLTRSEDQARNRMKVNAWILAVVMLGVVVLYALDHPPVTEGKEFAGVYNYLFLLYVSYAVAALVGLAWRYASMAEAPMLRIGQRMVSIACALGLVFMATTVTYLADADLDLNLPGSPEIARPAYTVAAVLFVIGLTLPAWGPRVGLESLWWRVARWHATRRLERLWRVVTDACPGVVLDREFLAASPYGKRLAAERLPVEIHDGWLHLRYYLLPSDVTLIDQLAGDRRLRDGDRDSHVAAARLLVATWRASRAGSDAPPAAPPVEHLGSIASKTLVGEARFLCTVSKRLHSGFVGDAVAAVKARGEERPATEPVGAQ
jgi:hypothetical protein